MFIIDNRSRVPLYQQIIDNVERLAARGLLPADSRLPSVRALAVELSLNPNTVSRAYSELEARGIIYSLPGRGNFIAATSDTLRQQVRTQQLQRLTEICREYEAICPGYDAWQELCRAAWDSTRQQEGSVSVGADAANHVQNYVQSDVPNYEGKGVQEDAAGK